MALYSKFGVPVDYNTGRDVALQPKQKFKFRVRFINFGGLESASYGFDASQQLIRVQRPTVNFESTNIGTYSGNIKVFNKPTFDPINITFRDDVANTLGKAAWSQMQKQFDFNNGRYAISAGAAKFTTIIETLDGQNEIRAIDSFVLENCFIATMDYDELDYSSGEMSTVSIGVEYDYIGSYKSESDGINDPDYLLWYVTSNATSSSTAMDVSSGNSSELFENPESQSQSQSQSQGIFNDLSNNPAFPDTNNPPDITNFGI
ncbi:hypothetical protein PBI_SCTP2_448 [Salicola phage SCTP-2]|nr:hypothetical protein PBI_SCTP2_448 [Salicola phage SCTP-2]